MSTLAVGIGQASIDIAGAWLEERCEEFTLREYERRSDAIAEMSRRLQGVRVLNYELGWLRDQGGAPRVDNSMKTAFGHRVEERACRLAIDVMGPEGCSAGYLVEKWYRDVKILDTFEGVGEIQRLTIGRELFR
jgi:acyl-CoA dehydrogenase